MKKLTKNFDFNEFMVSKKYPKTAKKMLIDDHKFDNLYYLCKFILQPIRDKFAVKMKVNSGYRDRHLNGLVGGVGNSLHLEGKAADITVENKNQLFEIYKYAKHELRDTTSQLILYIDDKTNEPIFIHFGLADYARPKLITKKRI